ncbi:putative proline rich protein 5 protein [Phaeoacremonium minimum UCRPA7]|uniref:Putative proline rich protein 5 protein n=1 Tax=Phaeoacremonium minimum (strain UCR-PA7) TaxID=1286976 RepID=R8BUG1_PHAM7|nr:putative proline rich protein 5 protein [Phaeoacremonium minimum UCRPA7]EOO03007.1 putative proline rich protein 5 protein [Phaeoacremonium minimum UCRPA7]
MLHQQRSLLSAAAVAAAVTTTLAGPAVVPKHNVATETTIDLVDPPMVTEVVPVFSEILTSIETPGKITLGLGCGLLGLGCIAKTISIESPTVCTVTVVDTKTTTHVELIRVDLLSGTTTTVTNSVGNGDGANALAYNPLDNYLYARQGTKIVRIHADGTTDDILDLPSATTNVFVGDIDETGFFWVSNGGSDWYKIDMRPLSSTFGQFLANGTVAKPVSIADWVYFPFGGSYLYSLGAINKGISLVRFSLDTFSFSTVRTLPQLAYHTYGAQYGMNNGTLYASDNTDGTIWAIPIDGSDPWISSQGPKSSSNDGARCVWNLVI